MRNMKRTVPGLVLAICGLLLTGSVRAGDSNFAVGAKAGTLGVTVDATVGLSDSLNVRVAANALDYSTDAEYDAINYDVQLDFQSLMLTLDWFPLANNFRFTGGVIKNDNGATIRATPTEAKRIGDTVYAPEVIGTLTGILDFDEVAPYFGIGFGNAVGEDTGFSFSFDLGVLIQSYTVRLSATGPATLIPGFAADLDEEEEKIQKEANEYELYPVVAVGFAYQF